MQLWGGGVGWQRKGRGGLEVGSLRLADQCSCSLRSWSWGGLHTLLQVGAVGHVTRMVVGSGQVSGCSLQWRWKLLVVRSGLRQEQTFPCQTCCWPVLRGMPQRSAGDGWLGAFTQVFASLACPAPWSCRCGSKSSESVGTELQEQGPGCFRCQC